MTNFELVPFDLSLAGAFERLFVQEGFDRPPGYLSWLFQPAGEPGLVAVARDPSVDSKIVGLLGLIPSRLNCRGQTLKTHVAIDLVVDREYRGRGIFTGLASIALEEANRRGAQVVWGFPNQAAAPAWFGRFGWANMGSVPLMVRPLRSGFILRRLMPWFGRIDFRTILPVADDTNAVRNITSFGAEAKKLWDEFSQHVGCCAIRDGPWLNWRLFQHPLHAYRTVASFEVEGDMSSFVCSRTEQKNGDHILYVMEAMGRNGSDESLTRLLRQELVRASSRGVGAALCWCRPQSPNYKVFRRAGFFPFPTRFRPRTSYFGAKVFENSLQPIDLQNWYISFLDLDAL